MSENKRLEGSALAVVGLGLDCLGGFGKGSALEREVLNVCVCVCGFGVRCNVRIFGYIDPKP